MSNRHFEDVPSQLDAAMTGMPVPVATVITTALAKAKGPKLGEMLAEADAEREALQREEEEEIAYYRQKRAREAAAQALQPSSAEGNGQVSGPTSVGARSARVSDPAEKLDRGLHLPRRDTETSGRNA